MPITLLPDHTIRAIGSFLVLNDACSVVKELVDNSLDSKATAITIEISSNTLDLIQVKDNGIGIGPEDRPHVCKANYTSKIETIEDLTTIGATSLGFRGQALASVAELSGETIVTTRIDGEIVGTKLKYHRDGSLVRWCYQPVGDDFLINVPVRRQTAAKSSTKILTAIKKLLQAYAFARPNVRISFKILRAKNDKQNWVYGPKPDDPSVTDVATRVIGKEATTQCVVEESNCAKRRNEVEQLTSTLSSPESGDIHILALVPEANSDLSKVSSGGQFISVDGRPITTTRGLGKDILRLFKSYVRSSASQNGQDVRLQDPFICMHIKSPPGSYDVNIEPAKDDMLFVDGSALMTEIENILQSVYGQLPKVDTMKGNSKAIDRAGGRAEQAGFNIMLATKAASHASHADNQGGGDASHAKWSAKPKDQIPSQDEGPEVGPTSSFRMATHGIHGNMATVDQDDTNIMHAELENEEVLETDDPKITNPWTLAKVNTSIVNQSGMKCPTLSRSKTLLSPAKSPSPQPYSNPGPPQRPWKKPDQHTKGIVDSSKKRGVPFHSNNPGTWIREPFQQASLQKSYPYDIHAEPPTRSEVIMTPIGKNISGPQYGDKMDAHNRNGTNETPPKFTHQSPGVNKPFVSPFKAARKPSLNAPGFDIISQKYLTPSGDYSTPLTRTSTLSSSTELDDVMEFESRKQAAQQAQRQAKLSRLQQSTLSLAGGSTQNSTDDSSLLQANPTTGSVANSPHHNRYLAAKARLSQSNIDTRTQVPATLSGSDPRHRLLRPATKLSRSKSSLLPLENIPNNQNLHKLRQVFHVPSDFRCLMESYLKQPSRVCHSTMSAGPPKCDVYILTSGGTVPQSISPTPTPLLPASRPQTSSSMRSTESSITSASHDVSSSYEEYISTSWSAGDIAASHSEITRWHLRLKELLCLRLQITQQQYDQRNPKNSEQIFSVAENISFDLHKLLKAFVETHDPLESTE
ncbi:putative dna mismatch repair [Phaeomoniella chlamydospora]|uniref:Putative dna mismatch repair n=1 Tax=Phaeomoniella chlamydospora TaxID=158046 RepID=A0A0G2GDH4_PHACM|nr:putative dna mismatch repair [Phaeomoniella chlamydospora]